MRRRSVLAVACAGLSGGVAGCLGGGGDGESGAVDDWLADVDNYDGTVDRTGRDRVEVLVGREGQDPFKFVPAAVAVSTGTTVHWEWTGEGGEHNVVAEDGAFESAFASREGYSFEHAFREAATHRYYCAPHRSLGMKGAVEVR